jgi:hypothetical protein
MSRPRPPSPDCIQDIKNRIELLLKVGPITKDLIINTEEAAAITGLSRGTLCRYGTLGILPTIKYPHRNLYPALELCRWVESHYHGITMPNTSLLNCKRRGRPRKE